MFSRTTLVGNLGADPDIRDTSNGNKICNLSVATSESWKDKNTGEKKERTEWHRVVVFGEGLVSICEWFLKKGSKIMVEGQNRTRKWTDQQGNDRWSTEVVVQGFGGFIKMLDSQSSGNRPPPADSPDDYGQGNRASNGANGGVGGYSDQEISNQLDDEIPF